MRNAIVSLVAAALLAGCAGGQGGLAPASAPVPGAARAAGGAVISVRANSAGPVVSADVYGANMGTWYNFRQPWVNPSLHGAGMHLFRFPGGSESDLYHWENGGSLCDKNMGYITPGATFDNFMKSLAAPLGADVAITLNYGSNRACNGGGDPTEAAAWVAYAKQRGYSVRFWTVGNEQYGSWEYDLHAKKHDPHVYSSAVKTGYYPDVKAADSSAQLGVVVDTPDDTRWNDVVLREAAPFDFVELHYYPEYTGSSGSTDSDSFLLGAALNNFAKDLQGLRGQMTAAGVPSTTPIYLGEFNSDAGAMGTQSVSITNGLFYGQMIAEATAAGVPRATWWIAYGSCDNNGDFSTALYGWQRTFGTEALFSDRLPESGCSNAPKIGGGTPFPTARVLALFSSSVPAGSTLRPTTVSLARGVRAYAYSVGSGYAILAFNNTLSPISVNVKLSGASRSSFTGSEIVYGKAQYDLSQNNQWVGPATTSLGTVGTTVPLTLGPYSMTVLALK